MKIKDIQLKIILDSRGNPTLEAEFFPETPTDADLTRTNAENNQSSSVLSRSSSVVSSVPAGKSKGSYEAAVLEPELAMEKFGQIKKSILEKDFKDQKEFDYFLISLDGTPTKKNLGGNLILVLSMCFARLFARHNNLELHDYLRSLLSTFNFQLSTQSFPHPIFNVINGGAHAKSSLDFQEFQIIPQSEDFAIGLSLGEEFYKKLQRILEDKFGKDKVLLGDEAGFSCPFSSNEEALEVMYELIEKNKYPLRIGLDTAATQFFKENKYQVGGSGYSSEQIFDYYKSIINRYNIISLEDPFSEDSFDDFAHLEKEMGGAVLVITDDLTVTNKERLKKSIETKSGNTILIKLTQIGTVSETLEVAALAYENNWKTIVSHRSGETLDDFIADLAVGIGAWGIKAGAPAKPERMAKYNRLLEIWQSQLKV
ncbi:MAG: Enolase [Candidatus Wolfebacteria bacterium GW2011_GWC1_43_10]|uniref:Enolase n=1 Tax=Candidatus Wolfebacteria bacterium GW2011_GWC1_43_10 TaxID=1619011 RepID=A0A0G1F7V1_9BACT|nr:MAG: Enolase [Candidatus Wolfebacteria bacterium GW2011_GWC1_43_10]